MTTSLDLIAHFQDLDGLLSHVIVEKRFPNQVVHHDIKYGNEAEPFTKTHTDNIILADLGYSSSDSFKEALKHIKKHKQDKITRLYDHHKWPKEVISEHFTYALIDESTSTTPLLENHFETDKLAKRFAQLAYNDDHDKADSLRTPLTEVLKSSYDTHKLIKHLSNIQEISEIIPSQATDHVQAYKENIKQAIQRLKQTYQQQDDFITCLSPEILYMKQGLRTAAQDHPNKNLLCLYENTNQALFSVTNSKLFNSIISRLNAGGRNLQGGISLEEEITSRNYQRLAQEIIYQAQ